MQAKLLRDLPVDILTLVLRKCLSTHYDKFTKFERNLPLLTVCRAWRCLAIPMVYSQAFVQYGPTHGSSCGLFSRLSNMEEPANVVVKTNLDLISGAGCANTVRCIDISVHCKGSPFPGWRDAIQRMRAVAIEWRAVELNAATFAPVPGHGTQSVDLAMYTDDLVAVSDALVQLLPNVRRLNFGGTKSPPLDSALYGRLAGHYAEQLQHIYCKYPISVPPGHPFQRLQSVWIIDDRVADYELPQMASGELVDLALSCGPVNHSWASFSTDSDSRVIEFTKLKKLSTSYLGLYKVGGIAVRHRDGHPWILRLPELKRLSISCRESMCPLLEYAVLPPRMVSIAIELTLAAFQQQADVVLPATKSLSLKVSQWSGGNPGGFSVINRLVDNARRSGSVELMINDHTLAVHPESITCTALTRLVVAGPASIDTMLALIKQMPRLSELAFGSLTPGHIQTDISIPDADQAAAVEPLSTSLRVLEMAYDPEPVSSDLAVALAQCMLLRIPSLVKLHTSDTPKDLVLDFVDEYAEHYPRLEGVELFFGY